MNIGMSTMSFTLRYLHGRAGFVSYLVNVGCRNPGCGSSQQCMVLELSPDRASLLQSAIG